MTVKKSITKEVAKAYDEFGNAYWENAKKKVHNAYYERPAMIKLLEKYDLKGKKVVDAGSASGFYSEYLVEKGAKVTAFDVSDEMVRVTKEKVGDKAEVFKADLTKPLDFLENGSVDYIVCSLILHYVYDMHAVFREFHRKLKSGGKVIFCIHHPFSDFSYYEKAENYYKKEVIHDTWTFGEKEVEVVFYRRPLTEIIDSFLSCGFKLETFYEPQPVKEGEKVNKRQYDYLMKNPCFLCMEVVK